jgi:hypothetical protein
MPSQKGRLSEYRASTIRRWYKEKQHNFKRLVGLEDKGRVGELNMYSSTEQAQ